MSNQVASSNYAPYMPSVGANTYLKGTTGTVAVGTTSAVVFTNIYTEHDTENFIYNSSTGAVTILKDGIYAMDTSITMMDLTNPAMNDINYGITLYKLYNGLFESLSTRVGRIPAIGGGSGATGSLWFCDGCGSTVYLRKDTVIDVRVTNFAPTVLQIMNYTQCRLNIQRIA